MIATLRDQHKRTYLYALIWTTGTFKTGSVAANGAKISIGTMMLIEVCMCVMLFTGALVRSARIHATLCAVSSLVLK